MAAITLQLECRKL